MCHFLLLLYHAYVQAKNAHFSQVTDTMNTFLPGTDPRQYTHALSATNELGKSGSVGSHHA